MIQVLVLFIYNEKKIYVDVKEEASTYEFIMTDLGV
jgi:hypothetical protein